MTNKTFAISDPLVQATLQYLSGRPYAEVMQLIAAIQQEVAPQLQEQKPAENKKPAESKKQ